MGGDPPTLEHSSTPGCPVEVSVSEEGLRCSPRLHDSILTRLIARLASLRLCSLLVTNLPGVARKLGILNAFFCIFIAAALSYIGPKVHFGDHKNPEYYAVPLKWVPFPTMVAYWFFEVM